jgi:aminopeptidase-like protein
MPTTTQHEEQERGLVGEAMHRFVTELYPICRSITGNGLRETLRLIQKEIPLTIHEVLSGTQVFDWTIPNEWNIRDAYIKNSQGRKVVDFQRSSLHVLNYSVPIHTKMSLEELKPHLFSLPDHPEWIPYRTSYYKPSWGFCLSHKQLQELEPGEYEVVVDSTLEPGSLSYGELYIEGESQDEILISCHSCHPALCNDNLSGIAVSTYLAKHVLSMKRRYSYRFLFIPGAIGSIAWLAGHESLVGRIKHGLVMACVGDPGQLTYKKSRRGNAEIDRVVEHVLKHTTDKWAIREFSPYGYDERQYCSPAFNLAVGSLTRTPHGEFPEYHTSADNLDFVKKESLGESLHMYKTICETLEGNRYYQSQNPKCEPQLGKRGLYRTMGGDANQPAHELAMLWVLNLSDGTHSLLDIAERAGLYFVMIETAVKALRDAGLLSCVEKQK